MSSFCKMLKEINILFYSILIFSGYMDVKGAAGGI
jgi:hypothetical protein